MQHLEAKTRALSHSFIPSHVGSWELWPVPRPNCTGHSQGEGEQKGEPRNVGKPEMGAQFPAERLQDGSINEQTASAELKELDKHQGLIIPTTWGQLSLSSRARSDCGAEPQGLLPPADVGFSPSPCPGLQSSPAVSSGPADVIPRWDLGGTDEGSGVQRGDFNLYRLCLSHTDAGELFSAAPTIAARLCGYWNS